MTVDPRAPELVADDFVAMMNASHRCVLIHDAATKNILWANPAACAMLEFTLDELRPLKAHHMSSSAQQYDRVLGRAWLQDAVDNGVSRIEWHYRAKSGRVIPTDAIAVRVDLAQGPAVMVQFRDIESEQRTEQELRLATSYVDALARHTTTVAVMLDAAGQIRFATDSALGHLGLNGDEEPPIGTELGAYVEFLDDGRALTWQQLAGAAEPVRSVRLRVRGLRGLRGPRVWLEGSLERLAEQPFPAYLMILHDVSDRVRAEQQRALRSRQENYQARYTAMGDMAMAIAHELGQPLAAAGNFLAGIRRHLDTAGVLVPTVRYGLDSADRQLGRATSIVSSLRAFVGHLEHVEEVVDLNEIVDECLYFARLRADGAGVAVDLELHPHALPVRCERVLTGQVVLNLCFNAVDEMAQSGGESRRVRLSTATMHGQGTFTVADRGRGLQRDPFEESFTSKEHGSGIGLALSYRIITRQHGRIWWRPRQGGGSVFGFGLPLAVRPEPSTG